MVEKKHQSVWIPVDIIETVLGGLSPRFLIQPFTARWVFCYLQSGAHEAETSIFNGNETEKDEDDSGKRRDKD